jgi:hypothetical protein
MAIRFSPFAFRQKSCPTFGSQSQQGYWSEMMAEG